VRRRVAIGLPTYNRPDLLRKAVESLQAQTHSDLDILISDNASPDARVQTTVEELAERDPRIQYLRRARNEGAAANFKAVLRDADAPYFMWASDDDLWDPHFVERCLGLLETNLEAQMAFGSVDNVNLDGVVVRTYPGFSRHSSTGDRSADLLRFVAEPEILGKANLIYGLYRTAALKAVVEACWDNAGFDRWSGDAVLVFAFINRHSIVVIDDVLLHKRVPTTSSEPLRMRDPNTYLVLPQHLLSFVRRHQAVAPDAGMASMIARAFRRRFLGQYLVAAGNRDFWRAVVDMGRRRLSRLVWRTRP
jgi:glycosyltransferase involved in cell wall biosynthesis